jgi:hypothetical protein
VRGAAFILLFAVGQSCPPQAGPIPHAGQAARPGAVPEEAIKKMTVPEGFKVDLVASEPDITRWR